MKQSIKYGLLIITIVPLITICISAITISTIEISSFIRNENANELQREAVTIEISLDQAYPGDYEIALENEQYFLYKGNFKLFGPNEYLDKLKSYTGYEYFVCCQNTIVSSTFNNNSFDGNQINDDIWNELIKNENDYCAKGKIGDNYYWSYYTLLTDSNSNPLGVLSISKPTERVNENQIAIIKHIFYVIALFSFLMVISSYFYGKEIADTIQTLRIFVNYVSHEKFNNKLDDKIYNRQDELGEIGRDVTTMRNSLRGLIEIDPLTNLLNRRTGDKKFKEIKQRCVENKKPFSFCIADIDHFKKVNDTYGHDVGDVVLEEIAKIIKRRIKGAPGFVARWGGEEFMICFEGYGSTKTQAVLESIRKEIENKVIFAKTYHIKVTMTFGVVEVSSKKMQQMSDEEIFDIADSKLYYGKENGRNQVVI